MSFDRLATASYLCDEHRVQVALVQEAKPPVQPQLFHGVTPDPADASAWTITLLPRMTGRSYASAIVLLDQRLSLTPMPATPLAETDYGEFGACHPGQVAVARLGGPGLAQEVVLASLCGLWHAASGTGAEATLHRALSDLTPLFLGTAPVVLAGDLNLFRNTDNVGQRRFDTVFTRLEAYGLRLRGPFRSPGQPTQQDCTCGQSERCDHVETYRRWHANAKPYQDDYVFASESLEVHSCEAVIDRTVTDFSDRAQRFGDHWPVIARFDLT